MINIILVGTGGFIGSVLRYLIGLGVHSLLRSATFPYGTLAANLIGCLLIGLLNGLTDERLLLSPQTRLFLMAGMLGGFTTFSAFSLVTRFFPRRIWPRRRVCRQLASACGLISLYISQPTRILLQKRPAQAPRRAGA